MNTISFFFCCCCSDDGGGGWSHIGSQWLRELQRKKETNKSQRFIVSLETLFFLFSVSILCPFRLRNIVSFRCIICTFFDRFYSMHSPECVCVCVMLLLSFLKVRCCACFYGAYRLFTLRQKVENPSMESIFVVVVVVGYGYRCILILIVIRDDEPTTYHRVY